MGIQIVKVSEDAIDVVADEIAEFVGHFAQTLSPDGVFLESQDCPQKGRELRVTLRLADGFVLVSALAMVAWRREPRADSGTAGGFALHFLRVGEGADFLQRLVRESREKGRDGFSVEREAPLTSDGKPLEESALDQMMAQRGGAGVAADLVGVASMPDDREPVDSPDFAPGFGRVESWDRDVPVPIPGEINAWLEEGQEPVISASVPPPPIPTEPAPTPGSTTRAEPPEAAEPAPRKRSGPIKMKMKSDRQPSPEKLPVKASESFVEVSRRASELMAGEVARSAAASLADQLDQIGVSEPDHSALATIAVGPGEMAKFLETAEAIRTAEESTDQDNQGMAVEAMAEQTPALGRQDSLQDEPEAASPYQPALRIDSDILGQELKADSQFGYPEEERGPMMMIGILVGVILVALLLWSVL